VLHQTASTCIILISLLESNCAFLTTKTFNCLLMCIIPVSIAPKTMLEKLPYHKYGRTIYHLSATFCYYFDNVYKSFIIMCSDFLFGIVKKLLQIQNYIHRFTEYLYRSSFLPLVTSATTNTSLPNNSISSSYGFHHPTTLHQASNDLSVRVESALMVNIPSETEQGW